MVGGESYAETFAKVFGPKSAAIPAATITFMTGSAALMYSIILGDLFASIATLAGAMPLLCRSNTWILLLGPLVLFPLSLMKDLSSLALGAGLGTAGTVYTCLFMLVRLFDRSYAPGGRFHEAIAPALRPRFAAVGAAGPIFNVNMFVLVSMLATTYVAHYNAPKFYSELAPPKDGTSKVPRFNLVVCLAFGLAATLCAAIMAAGFLNFGANSQGLILNNYATADALALVARLGIGASILFSFPINFLALRTGVLGLFGLNASADRASVHVGVTASMLAVILGTSLLIKDLGLVVAVGGAVLGSALVYVYPAIMFVALMLKRRAAGEELSASQLAEMNLNRGMAVLGVALAVIGAVMSLLKGA